MRVMEIFLDKFESKIAVRDLILKKYFHQTVFKDNSMTHERILDLALEKARLYGVKEIVFIENGVGDFAYDYLERNALRTDPFRDSIDKYQAIRMERIEKQ